MVAGAWMGLAVKTDGAAVASGAIVDSLIRAKAQAVQGIRYEPGWILMTATTVKIFIDVFIGVWAFVLAVIWCAKIDRKEGRQVRPGDDLGTLPQVRPRLRADLRAPPRHLSGSSRRCSARRRRPPRSRMSFGSSSSP